MWEENGDGTAHSGGSPSVGDDGRWIYTQSPDEYSHPHQDIQSMSEEEPITPLGLMLKKTPSLVNLIEDTLNHTPSTKKKKNVDDFASPAEKLKASNFAASFLRIGDFEVISKHDGNLVAKCYFAKRKLVWEILEGPLKKKVELQWSNIVGLRATILANQPSILEIELNEPPLFYRETDPQPRKHTLWQQSHDFTGGHASQCRMHYVRFPPGALDKTYENILLCDPRLHNLSRRPFPTQQSPYFDPFMYGSSQFFEKGCGSRHHLQELQCQYPNYPSTFGQPNLQKFKIENQPYCATFDSDSPMSVMNFNCVKDQTNNYSSTPFCNELFAQEHAEENEVLQGLPNEGLNVMNYDRVMEAKNVIQGIENQLFGEGEIEMCPSNQNILFSMDCPFFEPLEGVNMNINACMENAHENMMLGGNAISPEPLLEQQRPPTVWWSSDDGSIGASSMMEYPPLQPTLYPPSQDFFEAESRYYQR